MNATNATNGIAQKSISAAIAKGNMPQNSANVCLWCILQPKLEERAERQHTDLQVGDRNWDESYNFHTPIC